MISLTLVVLNNKKPLFPTWILWKLLTITVSWKCGWKFNTCNLCVIWQHYPCDMYIDLYTIGLTGVTEWGTVTFHFAPNRRRFHKSISRWILLPILYLQTCMPNTVVTTCYDWSIYNISNTSLKVEDGCEKIAKKVSKYFGWKQGSFVWFINNEAMVSFDIR